MVRKVLHSNFSDWTTFLIHQTKKTSILPGLLEIAWKIFLTINFWFFNENQSNLLVCSPQFQESPPFGHLSVKRATLFRAFLPYWFLPFLAIIWTFCHACHWNRCKTIFWAYNLWDPAKFWYTISLEMALNGNFLAKNGFWKLSTC